MTDYEKTWEDFWKSLCTNPDGSLNLDQIKRELHDFHTAMDNVGKVYCHITGNRISKINTLADAVIAEADEHYSRDAE